MVKMFQKTMIVSSQDPKIPHEVLTRADIMKKPERLKVEEQFTITIERGLGDIHFRSGIPRQISDITLAWWLSGGPDGKEVQESDWTGIVMIPVDEDVTQAIAFYTARKLKPDNRVQEAMTSAIDVARKNSNERTLRAIRGLYNGLQAQYKINKEQGGGLHEPSPVEFLAAYILASEEAKRMDDKSELVEQFSALMKKVSIG